MAVRYLILIIYAIGIWDQSHVIICNIILWSLSLRKLLATINLQIMNTVTDTEEHTYTYTRAINTVRISYSIIYTYIDWDWYIIKRCNAVMRRRNMIFSSSEEAGCLLRESWSRLNVSLECVRFEASYNYCCCSSYYYFNAS